MLLPELRRHDAELALASVIGRSSQQPHCRGSFLVGSCFRPRHVPVGNSAGRNWCTDCLGLNVPPLVLWVSLPYRHYQRIKDQFLGDRGLHGPANHTPGEQIFDHSRIQLTLMGADERDICHTRFIRWEITLLCGAFAFLLQSSNLGEIVRLGYVLLGIGAELSYPSM